MTIVGSYASSASPYGTFDQGGNGQEWLETLYPNGPNGPDARVARGGGLFSLPDSLASSSRILPILGRQRQ
jgi:hypothetical protein